MNHLNDLHPMGEGKMALGTAARLLLIAYNMWKLFI